MERQRGIKGLSIVALLVAIVGLSIAFAALSQTLTINGTAKVEASTWDVHYALDPNHTGTGADAEKVAPTVTRGSSSTATATAATLSGTSVSGFDVILKEPGDVATYEWDVINSGDIDAKIGTFIKPSLACIAVDSNGDQITGANAEAAQAVATAVCQKVTYTLTYTSSSGDPVDTYANNTRNDLVADTTNNANKKHLVLTIGYDLNKQEVTMPAYAVKITSYDTTTQGNSANNLYIVTEYVQK